MLKKYFCFVVFIAVITGQMAIYSDIAFAQKTHKNVSMDYGPWLEKGNQLLEILADRHSLPLSIAIVSSFKGKRGFKLKKIQAKTFNKLGMLRLIDNDAVKFSSMFNPKTSYKKEKGKDSLEESVRVLFGLSHADMVLHSPKSSGGNWSIRYDDGKSIDMIADSRPPENRKKLSALYEWVLGNLGYNGVILDQRDDLFLIAAPPSVLKEGAQAVVLGDTSKSVLVDQVNRKGTALLKYVQSSGIFAVLKVTFKKPGKQEPKMGDKLSVSI